MKKPEAMKADARLRSRLRRLVLREIARDRSRKRAEEILREMEEHHVRQAGRGCDPWLLIRNSILFHLGVPPDARFSEISDREVSRVIRRVVDRVRSPNDEAVSKLLTTSFLKIPGIPTPSFRPFPSACTPAAPGARSLYGDRL